MFQKLFTALTILSCSTAILSCNSDSKSPAVITDSAAAKPVSIKTENIDYTGDGVTMKGFAAWNDSLKGPLPVVLIVHEWWGQTDYLRMRAKKLAELGYLAFAVDMYGDGKTVDSPQDAEKLATPFYGSLKVSQPRFEAALAKVKTLPKADTTRIAAIGYCFGGGMVLNMARAGEPLKGVVSFHGSLVDNPADKKLLKAEILVCHGEADQFVKPDEVAAFKKQMDSIGAVYTFKSYPGATHAFTNPAATEKGKKYNMPIAYNAAADSASWNDMKIFLEKIFK